MTARSPKNVTQELSRLFQAAAEPVYALDEDGRIIFVNAALESWLGVNGSDCVGLRCTYAPSNDEPPALPHGSPGEIAAALCPPPEVFQGERLAGRVICPGGDSARERQVEFFPLMGEAENCVGVLAIIGSKELPTSVSLDESTFSENGDAVGLHERLIRFRRQWRQRFQLGRVIGDSPTMRRVRSQISLAALGNANVLIVGPPGSGRKHIARTIHALADPTAERPLPILRCDLWNAEQFADQWNSLLRNALLQRANSSQGPAVSDGTRSSGEPAHAVLLSDVDTLSPDAQSQLLRYLNGSTPSIRVLATASRMPIETAGEETPADPTFRPELACTLSTLTITAPPLSERIEDIPLLAQAFLEDQNALGRKQLSRFTADALESLSAYSWPGNIAELAAFVAESHRNADGPFVESGDLPKRIRLALDANARPKKSPQPIQLPEILNQVEAELLRRALTESKRNKSKAASLLGLTRQQLHRRMTQLGLE